MGYVVAMETETPLTDCSRCQESVRPLGHELASKPIPEKIDRVVEVAVIPCPDCQCDLENGYFIADMPFRKISRFVGMFVVWLAPKNSEETVLSK